MFVYINDAPKLEEEIGRNMGICYVFRAVATR